MLLGVEGDASADLASPSSSARSVDVGLSVLRGLNLDDQVDIGNIQTS